MDDYVKRQEAIEAVKYAWAKGLEPTQYIEIIPAAQVREDVRAEWVFDSEWWDYVCTNCNGRIGSIKTYNFCPNCGARMKGK